MALQARAGRHHQVVAALLLSGDQLPVHTLDTRQQREAETVGGYSSD